MTDELLKPKEVALMLNISLSKTYYLISQGVLPSIHLGVSVRVPRRALDEWIEKSTYPGVVR